MLYFISCLGHCVSLQLRQKEDREEGGTFLTVVRIQEKCIQVRSVLQSLYGSQKLGAHEKVR